MEIADYAILFSWYSIGLVFLIAIFSLPSVYKRIKLAKNKGLFKCIMCGTCCRIRIIPLKDTDIKRIEEKGYTDFWEKKGREKVMKRAKGRCIFLKDDKCSIQDFKPDVCGEFPFFKLYGFIPYCRLWYSCPGIEQLEKDVKRKQKTN